MNNYNAAQRINAQVNACVTYKTDLEQYDRPEFYVCCSRRVRFEKRACDYLRHKEFK